MVKNLFIFFLGGVMVIGIVSGQGRIRTITTGAAQGEFWLHWDHSARIGFVRGYLSGIHVGYRDGCLASDKGKTTSIPGSNSLDSSSFADCLDKAEKYSKEPEYYEAQITRFYESYKSDVGLSLDELLRSLSDSEKKTPEQIHQWFAPSIK